MKKDNLHWVYGTCHWRSADKCRHLSNLFTDAIIHHENEYITIKHIKSMVHMSLEPRQYSKAVESLDSGVKLSASLQITYHLGLRGAACRWETRASRCCRKALTPHGPGLIAIYHHKNTAIFLRSMLWEMSTISCVSLCTSIWKRKVEPENQETQEWAFFSVAEKNIPTGCACKERIQSNHHCESLRSFSPPSWVFATLA